MKTWINISDNTDFSIYNLPYGVYENNGLASIGIAIGDYIIDLEKAADLGIFETLNINNEVFEQDTLNDFISLGKETTNAFRLFVQAQLCDENSSLKANFDNCFTDRLSAKMLIPIAIGDYTDFYSSEEHATNLGKMFRPNSAALLPNWKHIPVGYHGRASSVVVSGTPLHRPLGQVMPLDADKPVFKASTRVDIELEMGFIIGKNTQLGDAVKVDVAADYIFGMVTFNDWSARDIQKWEYVPLGPFLGKNFGSTISPWIVTMEALEPFRVKSPKQDVAVLDYLKTDGKNSYDINLEVFMTAKGGKETLVSTSNHKYLYWSMVQQLAHHTVNGCNVKVGDLMASGTISGPGEMYGSFIEKSMGGKQSFALDCGANRKFMEDYDSINMKAHCEKDGIRIGFGNCEGTILPTKD